MAFSHDDQGVSRRTLLQAGAGLAGGVLLPGGLTMPVYAADKPPIGTWPEGSKATPSTSVSPRRAPAPYAVQGEDELKGWQLAVEHINEGHALMKKIAPKVTKGLLGKQVKLVGGRLRRQAEPGRAGATDLHQ